jgi:hypothetical protein
MLVRKSRRKIEGGRTSYPPHSGGTRRFTPRIGARYGATEKICRRSDTSAWSFRVQKIIGLYNALPFEALQQKRHSSAWNRSRWDRQRTKIVDDEPTACTFDLRTALAARTQKQRFCSTLIGG